MFKIKVVFNRKYRPLKFRPGELSPYKEPNRGYGGGRGGSKG